MSATISKNVCPAVASGWARLFGACVDAIARYFVCRTAVGILQGLDDRALRDIGLARSQIEAAVRGLISIPDRAEDATTASSAARRITTGPRPGESRRTSRVEAAPWS
jgi:uncharacterized protein YjiS (DUF1127 family)